MRPSWGETTGIVLGGAALLAGGALVIFVSHTQVIGWTMMSAGALAIIWMGTAHLRGVLKERQKGSVGIYFENRAPYLRRNGMSVVSVGIRNTGRGPLSQCGVYVERISGASAHLAGVPMLMSEWGFTLRPGDPERLVQIAHRSDNGKLRFSASHGGNLAEEASHIDLSTPQTFFVRVQAIEAYGGAAFRISADSSGALQLERLSERR